jgi:hypothetical protein
MFFYTSIASFKMHRDAAQPTLVCDSITLLESSPHPVRERNVVLVAYEFAQIGICLVPALPTISKSSSGSRIGKSHVSLLAHYEHVTKSILLQCLFAMASCWSAATFGNCRCGKKPGTEASRMLRDLIFGPNCAAHGYAIHAPTSWPIRW